MHTWKIYYTELKLIDQSMISVSEDDSSFSLYYSPLVQQLASLTTAPLGQPDTLVAIYI